MGGAGLRLGVGMAVQGQPGCAAMPRCRHELGAASQRSRPRPLLPVGSGNTVHLTAGPSRSHPGVCIPWTGPRVFQDAQRLHSQRDPGGWEEPQWGPRPRPPLLKLSPAHTPATPTLTMAGAAGLGCSRSQRPQRGLVHGPGRGLAHSQGGRLHPTGPQATSSSLCPWPGRCHTHGSDRGAEVQPYHVLAVGCGKPASPGPGWAAPCAC